MTAKNFTKQQVPQKIVQMFSDLYCILQLYFVFYSNILYRFIACQTQKVHTPLKGSLAASMMKRQGSILPISGGMASPAANNAGTIRVITSTLHALYTNVLVAVCNSEPQQALYLNIVKYRYLIGSLQ